MTDSISDINIKRIVPLIPPAELHARLPLSERAQQTVYEGREAVRRILTGSDDRLLVIVGPCSIHDERAALEYAGRLRDLAKRVAGRLLVVMRVYFEKPRTTVGWKGLINDPRLDGSFDMDLGFTIARRILTRLAEQGLPAATEFLDPITPQYIADAITWAAIGARTTESQTHRQMASGLSMPVGFKNGTDGSLRTALDAMVAARSSHAFLGIDLQGNTCVVETRGNPYGHMVLRGGHSGANYTADALTDAQDLLRNANLPAQLMVDCSHANSEKDYRRQAVAFRTVVGQRTGGNRDIAGLMVESHLFPGRQDVPDDPSQLAYGVSVTDACIDWDETEALLLEAHAALELTPAG